MLKTIVIDDERPSREAIINYIRTYCSDVQVVATASSVKTAYKAINTFHPDFIFLDIEMPDGKGFDLLAMFENISFSVIFVTAYSEYAVKAFRFSAVDYLLKPVKIDELVSAVEKIKTLNGRLSGIDTISELLKNIRRDSAFSQTLVIPHSKGFDILKISEIIMCMADGYCTNFYVTDKRKYTSSKNLKHFDEMLEELNIIRVHHSYLVNINHVLSFSRQGEIFLSEGHKAYLGDSYKNFFIKKIGVK
jgi:two-component system, LytTR family, response regulator